MLAFFVQNDNHLNSYVDQISFLLSTGNVSSVCLLLQKCVFAQILLTFCFCLINVSAFVVGAVVFNLLCVSIVFQSAGC